MLPPGYVWPRIKQRIRLSDVIARGRPELGEPACLDVAHDFRGTAERVRSLCLLFAGDAWIEELDIAHLPELSAEWDFVVQILAMFPNLKSFRYAAFSFKSRRFHYLNQSRGVFEYIRDTTTLQRFEWEPRGGVLLDMERKLLAAIGQNHSITHLKFTSEHTSACGLPAPPHLADMFAANRSLKYVELGRDISARAAIQLLQSCLADHPSIVSAAFDVRLKCDVSNIVANKKNEKIKK